jgi:hypothetical protein
MSFSKLTFISTTLASVLALGPVSAAFAETAWERAHPRRDQVNDRLQQQNRHINQAFGEGELTRGQTRQLHRDDRQIRQEERNMSAQDGGHITRAEQRVLNQQENGVNRQLNRDTSRWASAHPWRDQVNDRLENQSGRINHAYGEGELTRGQDRQLHREDGHILREERNMAAQDGGHITRADQRVLNQQENAVNRQLNRDTSQWASAHPRRDQVNDRLENQSRRIGQEYREGELTRGQVRQLHREDGQILQEERDMAALDGGHITRPEQSVLNQQENVVSRQIGR